MTNDSIFSTNKNRDLANSKMRGLSKIDRLSITDEKAKQIKKRTFLS